MKPMLSTPIKQERLLELCADDNWVMQEKMDGKRCIVHIADGFQEAYGRSGQRIEVPTTFIEHVRGASFGLLDGELIKGVLHTFDVPGAAAGRFPYSDRLRWNEGVETSRIIPIPTAHTELEKLSLVHRLLTTRAEGIVARDLRATYEPGKRSRGSCKFKFTRDCDCFVTSTSRGGKNNIVLGVYDQSVVVEVGVALAPKCHVNNGDVVTVNYLRMSAAGRLVQPVRARLRFDKEMTECTIDQFS